jgi:lipopolysaccharide transport system ATP-binding protein
VGIRAENLSKRYRIGELVRYKTLRDVLGHALAAPGRAIVRAIGAAPGDGSAGQAHVWALRDVSFDVAPGEVVGVIGRNGAGKSTLLKILSRITEPTEGRARVTGVVGALLEVGTGFHPELTGRENIYLNGAILGMGRREIDRKFDQIVEFAEVEKFIDTPVKFFSSGMYLRLGFSVAAFLEPDILMVDEVLAVGDAAFQRRCLDRMQEIGGGGRTVLFVSHNMPAILRLCSRAILLDGGRIVADGRAPTVVERYMRQVVEAGGETRWDSLDAAPGTPEVRLTAVRLLGANDRPASIFEIEQGITVELVYHVATPATFRCALVFQTQGVDAFSAVQPNEVAHEVPGRYASRLTIPGNLLAEGEYTVSVSIFSSRGAKVRFVHERRLLAFHVFDAMSGNSSRGDYAEAFSGVVRPKLPWTWERQSRGPDPN